MSAPRVPWLARYVSYWRDFSVARGRLTAFRVTFFAVLGIDAFLQIAHAPRYGASGFNVSHLPWLDALLPMPGRAGMLIVFMLQSYLAFCVAMGAATRACLVLLTALYGYAYFISQLDSYQHHYLIFLLLLLSCQVPWERSGERPEGCPEEHAPRARAHGQRGQRGEAGQDAGRGGAAVQSWALRLVLVQIAIVYAWAAVSKLDPLWLDGSTLSRQMNVPWIRALFGRVLATDGDPTGFALAAKLVLAIELALAVAWPWRRLWPLALVLGVGLHAGIELMGLEIGVFSYFMFALYILIVPDSWTAAPARAWHRIAGRVGLHGARARVQAWMQEPRSRRPARMAVLVAAVLVAAAALVLRLPFPEMLVVAAITALLAVVAMIAPAYTAGGDLRARAPRYPFLAGVHLGACACLAVLGMATDQAHDYYRFWGGSSRRLGDWAGAETAYRTLVRISPNHGPGHYHLAEIERRRGNLDQALRGYRRAQQATPADARPWLGEARIHDAAGRGADAVHAARQALTRGLRRAQDLQQAQAILARWRD